MSIRTRNGYSRMPSSQLRVYESMPRNQVRFSKSVSKKTRTNYIVDVVTKVIHVNWWNQNVSNLPVDPSLDVSYSIPSFISIFPSSGLLNPCPSGSPMTLPTGVTALCTQSEQCSTAHFCHLVWSILTSQLSLYQRKSVNQRGRCVHTPSFLPASLRK